MSFGERLKQARLQSGYTQKQLAAKLGIAGTTITGYEKGNSEPNMLTIGRIISVLGVDANFLLQDDCDNAQEQDLNAQKAAEKFIKKYRDLDDHGKKLVDAVLSIEYERCSENPSSKEKAPRKREIYYAAANGGHAEPNDVDPDELDKLLSEHPTTYDV